MSDNKKPKTIEIDETAYRQLISTMAVLIKLFPREAERAVFEQLNKRRKKIEAAVV